MNDIVLAYSHTDNGHDLYIVKATSNRELHDYLAEHSEDKSSYIINMADTRSEEPKFYVYDIKNNTVIGPRLNYGLRVSVESWPYEIEADYLRLRSLMLDCKASINANRVISRPFVRQSIEERIAEMLDLWDNLPIKPSWISAAKINYYRRKLIEIA